MLWLFTIGVGLQQGGVLSPLLFIVYMNWIDSHSRVDKDVTVWSSRIDCLLFVDDLVLLTSSEQGLQHSFDQFSAACYKTGMKISTKKTDAFCLFRKASHCMLQVSENALQQVEKLKYLKLWYRKFIQGLIKPTQFCINFITLWSQNKSLQASQSCWFLNQSLF